VVLAPAVFLAPLFLFTRALARAKREALRRLDGAAVALSEPFERRWLRLADGATDDLLSDPAPSGLADVRTAWAAELPDRLRGLRELLSTLGLG
jgi:hypothetical protein